MLYINKPRHAYHRLKKKKKTDGKGKSPSLSLHTSHWINIYF